MVFLLPWTFSLTGTSHTPTPSGLSKPIRKPDAVRLRILTFNIRHDLSEQPDQRCKRVRLTARFLKEQSPDLLCLQEVTPEAFSELTLALQPEFSTFCPRDDGHRQGEGVPIMVFGKCLQVVREERFWLSATPEKPSFGWTARCRRIVSAVCLAGEDGRRIWLLNLHLDHRSREARANSLHLLRRKITTYRTEPDDAFILCGDFNMKPTDPLFPPFLDGDPPLLKATPLSLKRATFHGWGPLRLGRGTLDYCLHSAEFRTDSCEVVETRFQGRRISDHNAVQVDLAQRP